MNANGKEIGYGGGSLMSLSNIGISGLDARLQVCTIRVACDVTNPITGESGASRIFGPQKGVTEAIIVKVDRSLVHFADVIKKDLHVDVNIGVVHQYGIDAVFSVLITIDSLEEAFRGAFDNIYRALQNIMATLAMGIAMEG